MSTEDGRAVHEFSGRAGRIVAVFAFNLLLLLGSALPVGIAVMWGLTALAGPPSGNVAEGMMWITIAAVFASVVPAPLFVGVVMAMASLVTPGRRRAVAAGIAVVVVVGIAIIARRNAAALPLWAGLVAGMGLYAAAVRLSTERLPGWPAWIAAGLPAPLLIAALSSAAA